MLQSLPAGGAETAAHAAARLRRDAERGAVAVGDIGRFDEMPLHGTEQVLLRSVGRRADPTGAESPVSQRSASRTRAAAGRSVIAAASVVCLR